jgi:hypothetical protein
VPDKAEPPAIRFKMETLHARSGVTRDIKLFAFDLRKIAEAQPLPEYGVQIEYRRGQRELVTLYRDKAKPARPLRGRRLKKIQGEQVAPATNIDAYLEDEGPPLVIGPSRAEIESHAPPTQEPLPVQVTLTRFEKILLDRRDELPGLAARDATAATEAERQLCTFYRQAVMYRMLIDAQRVLVDDWDTVDPGLPAWAFDAVSSYGGQERWDSWCGWQRSLEETGDAANALIVAWSIPKTDPAIPSQE